MNPMTLTTPPATPVYHGINREDLTVPEYIVDDYLEMASFLTPEQRRFLIQEMRLERDTADAIEIHCAFSVKGRLIAISEGPLFDELWMYYSGERKIEKHLLKKSR